MSRIVQTPPSYQSFQCSPLSCQTRPDSGRQILPSGFRRCFSWKSLCHDDIPFFLYFRCKASGQRSQFHQYAVLSERLSLLRCHHPSRNCIEYNVIVLQTMVKNASLLWPHSQRFDLRPLGFSSGRHCHVSSQSFELFRQESADSSPANYQNLRSKHRPLQLPQNQEDSTLCRHGSIGHLIGFQFQKASAKQSLGLKPRLLLLWETSRPSAKAGTILGVTESQCLLGKSLRLPDSRHRLPVWRR